MLKSWVIVSLAALSLAGSATGVQGDVGAYDGTTPAEVREIDRVEYVGPEINIDLEDIDFEPEEMSMDIEMEF